ncbi:MAG: hypothetical protein ACTSQY_00240 [Candidatus Odinarchaeia archaeon]|nr:MAG: hypothetical protein [Lokiarchaeota virus Fenrir Meg22_1012]URC17227.1 MAG: hypothetical protein [Lokiarchaeota virus Fenrir Meg22_1214]
MELKEKLISFPKEVLDKLDEYKQKTGISSTSYIRAAVIRSMIVDGLIFFKTKYVEVEKESNGKYVGMDYLPEELKYCDGDSCSVSIPFKDKGC